MQTKFSLLKSIASRTMKYMKVRVNHNLFFFVIIKKSISESSSAKFFDSDPETATPLVNGNHDKNVATFCAVIIICLACSLPLVRR